MRVTTDMIFNRTMFNLSRNIERHMRVQTMLSSGRRINTPSDDPVGTHHDLNYRAQLTEIGQYLSNISRGTVWLSTYENGLADLKNLYSAVKEIAITMVNDSHEDAVTRQSAASEVESILDQVLQIANCKIDGRHMYSGHKTRTAALEASANGYVYRGDRGIINMEIDKSARLISNLIGEDIFLKQLQILGENSDLKTGLTADTLLADLNMGAGAELIPGTFEVVDNNRNLTYTIDLSGAVTVGDAVDLINTQLGAASNLSVSISAAGAALQWNPVRPPINTISLETPLSNLNNGAGVSMQPGTFLIRNADSSIAVEIDISSATTVGDVLTRINTTLLMNGVSGIMAGFNSDGTGLRLTDGNVPPLGLIVEECAEGQTTAADLGIIGQLDPILQGLDISPRIDYSVRDIGAQTTGADLGLLGSIHNTVVGQNIRPLMTHDTVLSSLNNGVGFGLGELKISHGNQYALINLGGSSILTIGDLLNAINTCGLEIAASINDAGTGIQVVPTVSGKSLIIESNDSTRTAHNLGIIGSSDMMGSLMLMITALRQGDKDVIGQLNGNVDLAMNELLSNRAEIGAKVIRMETTQNRLELSQINVTKLLSEVEDADIISLVSELGRQENLYQAALLASSRLLQQSLVDFLR